MVDTHSPEPTVRRRSSERRHQPLKDLLSVSPASADFWQRLVDTLGVTPATPEVVLFRSEVPGVPLERLIQNVAEAIHQAHGDRILVVDLVYFPKPPPASPPPEFHSGSLLTYRLLSKDGRAAAWALQRLARSLQHRWDYLFVRVDPRLLPGLVPPHGGALGFRQFRDGEVIWKLVSLSHDPLGVEPPPGFDRDSILSAVLLPPGAEHVPGPALPTGAVRLRLELERFTHRRSFLQCSPAEQETLCRWGRAITERIVGVALGGGGAWGFAHVAILRGMLERRIPIDVLSGTSFGAVVAAFYSGMGREGLDLLLKESPAFLGVVAASMINSRTLTMFFDRLLGHRRLEKVELPFFPVGTNVSESQPWVLRQGTLGAGIRSSGVMPGLLSPDYTEDGLRVVDGAFSDSVPVSVLKAQRANLIAAANVFPVPPAEKSPGPLLPGPVGWFLHGLNPVGRFSDLMRSTLILLHSAGEKNVAGADVVFDLPFTPIPPWAFGKGEAVMNRAASVIAPALDELEARWGLLAQRRSVLRASARAMRDAMLRAEAGGRPLGRVRA